jgi:hypothetical protein
MDSKPEESSAKTSLTDSCSLAVPMEGVTIIFEAMIRMVSSERETVRRFIDILEWVF